MLFATTSWKLDIKALSPATEATTPATLTNQWTGFYMITVSVMKELKCSLSYSNQYCLNRAMFCDHQVSPI